MGGKKKQKLVKESAAKKSYKFVKNELEKLDPAETVQKVVISSNLEKQIVNMIQDWKKSKPVVMDVSQRMTVRRLTEMYSCLAKAGFNHNQIETGMKNTVIYGRDLVDTLDWLCLNMPNDELPEGFSETLQREEDQQRPTFLHLQVDKSHVPDDSFVAKPKEKVKEEKSDENSTSVKDWILLYAEECSEEEEEENEEKLINDIEPDIRYNELKTQLHRAKEDAIQAKIQGNKTKQKEMSKEIQKCLVEMESIEKHPKFDPGLKDVTPADESSSSAGASSQSLKNKAEVEIDLSGLKLLEKEEEKPKAVKVVAKPIRFEYTRQQWTGKSPKQFLIDWCRKNLPRSPPPKFEKIQTRGHFKCNVKVDRKRAGLLSVCPEILCHSVKEAEHLGATLALYHLCKGQSVHQLLPPPFQAVWLKWQTTEQQAMNEAQDEENKPRDQLIKRLLRDLQVRASQNAMNDNEAKQQNLTGTEYRGLAPVKGWKELSLSGEARRQLFMERQQSPQYQQLLQSRQKLPVFCYKEKILQLIRKQNVLIVAGETGSGKSTQIPHFLLEDLILLGAGDRCNIICTEPRRLSAVSLAGRVSQELGEGQPGSKNSFCGYQIRFETRKTSTTCLMYCTTGVVLRYLHTDPHLKHISHLIIDEIHERTVQSDFLLIVLKQLLKQRHDLKIILMSATIDCERVSKYFYHCPIISIPGRTFSVNVFHIEDIVEMTGYVLEDDSPYSINRQHLEVEEQARVSVTAKGNKSHQMELFWTKEDGRNVDLTGLDAEKFSLRTRNTVTRMKPNKINRDLIVELLHFIETDSIYSNVEGAVLIFLPGLTDIQVLYELLQTDRRFSDRKKFQILALHSALTSQDQNSAFLVPPSGVRKIILSTNIAETGITIPDIVFIIDSGKVKENRFIESRQMSSLEEVFVSKASAKQRKGRAGRVRNGVCFRLYTHKCYQALPAFTVPELLRVSLEEVCLQIMKCNLGKPEEFLSKALDPPLPESISQAVFMLQEVGACDECVLTPLGHHLAALPVPVHLGKLLLFGAMFGCLEPVAVIAAAMSGKSPFAAPLDRQTDADLMKQSFSKACSDHLMVYQAYIMWKEAQKKGVKMEMAFCEKHFIKRKALLEIENAKRDLIRLVKSLGFEDQCMPESIRDIKATLLIKAVIVAGLYPNVAKCSAQTTDEDAKCCAETPQGSILVHPSSVNCRLQTNGWLVYEEKTKLSRVYLRNTTLVSPYPLLLFGRNITVHHIQQLVTIDKWIYYKTHAKTGVLFKELRLLLNELLQKKLEDPSIRFTDNKSIQLMIKLLQSEVT